MAGQFRKKYGEEGISQLGSSISKALRFGVEQGNPSSEGVFVDVSLSGGSGSSRVESNSRYAQPVAWSALPGTPGLAWTVSEGLLTVKSDSGFSGTISFWVYQ